MLCLLDVGIIKNFKKVTRRRSASVYLEKSFPSRSQRIRKTATHLRKQVNSTVIYLTNAHQTRN